MSTVQPVHPVLNGILAPPLAFYVKRCTNLNEGYIFFKGYIFKRYRCRLTSRSTTFGKHAASRSAASGQSEQWSICRCKATECDVWPGSNCPAPRPREHEIRRFETVCAAWERQEQRGAAKIFQRRGDAVQRPETKKGPTTRRRRALGFGGTWTEPQVWRGMARRVWRILIVAFAQRATCALRDSGWLVWLG